MTDSQHSMAKSAASAGNSAAEQSRRLVRQGVRFWTGSVVFLAIAMLIVLSAESQYVFFVGYVILQFIVLSTGWNILGGYAGYVNFGTAGYFAVGAYTTVALFKWLGLPLPVLLLLSGIMGALLGLAIGAMSMRLRGIYFSIATLAIAIILQTVATNWDYVGGARGVSLVAPNPPWPFETTNQLLFFIMALLVVLSTGVARYIERSLVGRGLQALRDDETAAECAGVPTLKLKLLAAAVSGAIMALAGAPFVFYMSFIEPHSAFSLNYALAAIAMPIIGGMSHWSGPIIGAILLASAQQVISVQLSGEWNVLVTGIILMVFVIGAPSGIVGLARSWYGRRRQS